jgi:hypothetical protein
MTSNLPLSNAGVRCDGTQNADAHKVGIIGVRLYAAPDDYHVQQNVFLKKPVLSRGWLVRRLTHYSGLAESVSRRQHPTRTVLGSWKRFEWLCAGEPFLEFNFQYFGSEL